MFIHQIKAKANNSKSNSKSISVLISNYFNVIKYLPQIIYNILINYFLIYYHYLNMLPLFPNNIYNYYKFNIFILFFIFYILFLLNIIYYLKSIDSGPS